MPATHALRFSKLNRTLKVLGVCMVSGSGALHATPEIAQRQRGAEIYKEQCLSCHGDKGQGVKGEYEEPLTGTRTLEALAKRIDRTMPEDDPDLCVGSDAEAVAAYIYDAFYSPEAQARNNPEIQALSRLTVSQYQNSVMDLVSRFRPANDRPQADKQGLKARYFTVKQMRREKVFERVDQQVAFHYGDKNPDPEKLKDDGFAVEWQGSIFAPETGHYEFIVRTENGIRFWLNTNKDPSIDAMVAGGGGEVKDEKKTLFLIGGRSYPIRLEFLTYKQKTASIELRWKPPHGVEQIIPSKYLNQNGGSERMVITTSFPADDRSDGYERGTTLSKEWDRATTNAALEVVAYAEKHVDWLANTKPDAQDRVEKLKKFAHAFAEGAFRRPLTDEQKKIFVDLQFDTAPTPELGVKRVILLSLKSPRFLYPDLRINDRTPPDNYEIAMRLALAMWDSIPDSGLLKMAAEGKLTDLRQIAAQANRMLDDPRAKVKLHSFFHHWLELERAELATKDAKLYPDFDAAMLAALRESLFTFIDHVVWSDSSDYRQLIGAEYLWLDERLAKYYGKDVKGGEYQKVAFNPNERAGIITHPYLLASFAYNKTTSPIHRGVFLTRNVVGMSLKSPPVAVAFEDSKFDPSLTMREKVTELTKDVSCMACHSVINPLGFSLEHYDAVGRWRTKDNNKPVDASGEFDTDDGRTVKLKGARDIASYAMDSPGAHRAFIRQLFHHFIKQPAGSYYGNETLDLLRESFANQNFNVRKLIGNIVYIHASQGLPESRNILAQMTKPAPPPAPKADKPSPPAAPAPAPAPQQAQAKPLPPVEKKPAASEKKPDPPKETTAQNKDSKPGAPPPAQEKKVSENAAPKPDSNGNNPAKKSEQTPSNPASENSETAKPAAPTPAAQVSASNP